MRLVTYNIHKGIGGRDRRYRLHRIIDVIAELDADLVCLQEVDRNVSRSHYDHQTRLLAEALGAAAALDQLVMPRGDGGYGNLVLSRWPFHDAEQFSIRRGVRKPRGAQVITVDTHEGRIVLAHGHLGLNERERHWQVDRLLSHAGMAEAIGLPTIVAGDSNDWRNSLHHQALARHGFTQVTSPLSRFRSFPAYLPMASLDKVFVRGGITVNHAEVVKTPLTRRASDHLPVVVDFTLNRV